MCFWAPELLDPNDFQNCEVILLMKNPLDKDEVDTPEDSFPLLTFTKTVFYEKCNKNILKIKQVLTF